MNKKEKKMEKRNRLMAAAEVVFSRRGYAQATVDEIIALADTGKGTLYNYFGNKNILFYTLVSQKHEDLMEKLQSVADDSSRGIEERLIGLLAVWIKFLRRNIVLWQVLCFEMGRSNMGYSVIEKENGEIVMIARWGKLPPKEEQESFLKYHRLLAEEAKPIIKVYREGIRQNFFADSARHEEIPKNLFWAMAIIVFSNTSGSVEKMTAEELASSFIKNRVHGLAAEK